MTLKQTCSILLICIFSGKPMYARSFPAAPIVSITKSWEEKMSISEAKTFRHSKDTLGMSGDEQKTDVQNEIEWTNYISVIIGLISIIVVMFLEPKNPRHHRYIIP